MHLVRLELLLQPLGFLYVLHVQLVFLVTKLDCTIVYDVHLGSINQAVVDSFVSIALKDPSHHQQVYQFAQIANLAPTIMLTDQLHAPLALLGPSLTRLV